MTELDPKLTDAIGNRVNALLRKGHDPDAVLDALLWHGMVLASTLDRQDRLSTVGAEMLDVAREARARSLALEGAEPEGSA